jgi:hypothetical protein
VTEGCEQGLPTRRPVPLLESLPLRFRRPFAVRTRLRRLANFASAIVAGRRGGPGSSAPRPTGHRAPSGPQRPSSGPLPGFSTTGHNFSQSAHLIPVHGREGCGPSGHVNRGMSQLPNDA